MQMPTNIQAKGIQPHICKLQATLYDLNNFLEHDIKNLICILFQMGLHILNLIQNLYIKHVKDGFTILVVYVDDGIVVGNNNQLIENFK
jgi:hypothetical protein